MTKALYRKWRPQTWDEVVEQEHVVQTLRNAVKQDRVAHAYLFAGPRGTGKTTCARLLAKAVNCLENDPDKVPCNQCKHCLAINEGRFLDLIEIDAASNTSVDDVRELRDKINFSPSQGEYKVYIIDEVHMLSNAAFNALLKTLEEPPPHAIFILATTEIHKIPATVLSRCQRHEFRRIPLMMIVNFLKKQSSEENLHVDEAVFVEIARQATGSLRDAISLLDQLTSTTDHITLELAQTILGTATNERVIRLINALIQKDAGAGLTQIGQALDNGTDPRQFARQIVTYLRNILLFKMDNAVKIEVADETRKMIHQHASEMTLQDLLRAIEAFNQATVEEHANWHPGLGLELAFTAFLAQPEVSPPPAITPVSPDEKSSPQPQIPPATPEATKQAEKKPDPQLSATQKTTKQKKQPVSTPEKPDSSQTPPAEEGALNLNTIQAKWKEIKQKVGQHNRRAEALLNSCRLLNYRDDTLILGFSSKLVKDLMEKKEGNITLTTDILEEVCGAPINIKCLVTSHESGSVPTDLAIDQDGMVSTATRDLGGKISKAEEAED